MLEYKIVINCQRRPVFSIVSSLQFNEDTKEYVKISYYL